MRSLHVIGSRSSGGAERFYVRLTAALARRGEEVTCVLPPGSALRPQLDPSLAQRPVRMSSVFDLIARARIGRCAKLCKADVVQTYMGRATRLTHIARTRTSPVHIARLGGYYDVKGYRHAHAWVVNARGIRDYLIDEGLDRERIFYIGNFVEATRPRSAGERQALRDGLGLEPDAVLLVCLGRLHRNKGFDVMLEALASLPERVQGRPLRTLFVGDGPERYALVRQCEDLGLGHRVRWVGWSDAPEPFLQLADLFVCPSRHEPLGNVVLEAWNEGIPVLASRTGGLAELISHGENGALVPPGDPDALAQALLALLTGDAAVLRGLVQGGARSLESQHSERAVVDAYLELYRRLLDAR
jgi:glycosyltransferase involved in cell wall biosynthesis